MIRYAQKEDLVQIRKVYTAAKEFMNNTGNPNQWNDGYPSDELLLEDMRKQQLFVEEHGGIVNAVFVLAVGDDPTYDYIEDGQWLSSAPYGTIHRLASNGSKNGFFVRCVDFCRGRIDHLRIDTHRDNVVMQHLIDKNGFQRCGIIYLANGDPRIAYELI